MKFTCNGTLCSNRSKLVCRCCHLAFCADCAQRHAVEKKEICSEPCKDCGGGAVGYWPRNLTVHLHPRTRRPIPTNWMVVPLCAYCCPPDVPDYSHYEGKILGDYLERERKELEENPIWSPS